jgi:DDE_Tnp_1-associated/Transposase DDE domain
LLKVGKRTFFSYAFGDETQKKLKEVEMESNIEGGQIFDVGSLYDQFCELRDSRKARGKRYKLATILTLMTLAKLCGEDTPSGIAEWAKHRTEFLCEMLRLGRKTMPHRSSYQRILEAVVSWDEMEQRVSNLLSGKRYFGKQVLVAIDGKVLRGTLDEKQNGVYLLAAYLPGEGLVLMEVVVKGKGHEIEAASQVLKSMDLREKVIMGDALHTQRPISIQIVEAGGDYIWFAKATSPNWKKMYGYGWDPTPFPFQA